MNRALGCTCTYAAGAARRADTRTKKPSGSDACYLPANDETENCRKPENSRCSESEARAPGRKKRSTFFRHGPIRDVQRFLEIRKIAQRPLVRIGEAWKRAEGATPRMSVQKRACELNPTCRALNHLEKQGASCTHHDAHDVGTPNPIDRR